MTVVTTSVRIALAFALALSGAVAAACQGAAGNVSLTITADRLVDVAADGLSPVTLTAEVFPANAVDAVSFAIVQGFGDLSATRALVVDGKATVLLYPPRDSELRDGAARTAVKAFIPLAPAGQEEVAASTEIAFVLPSTGEPQLDVLADPPFVARGSGEPMKLKIEGRYLTSSTVTLSTSSSVIALPAQLTLEGEGAVRFAEIEIPAPAEPADIDITVRSGDEAADTVTAHFTAEGAPAFDVTGTFVQVTFGRKRISEYGLLKNDPDCVAADAISLVVIEHVGNELTLRSESCDIKMPTVEVTVGGVDFSITPPATAGFIAATNLRDHDVTFALDGAHFDVPADHFLPHVVGADLANPATDELPTDPALGLLADDDNDGEPGVTIPGPFFPIPDTHLSSRTFTESMVGDVVDSNSINGVVATRSESKTYGDQADSPKIDDAPSPFHLRRVDGDYGSIHIGGLSGNPEEITCDDVNRYAEEILAQLERPELVCN